MKKKLSLIFAMLLITLGVGLIGYSFYGKYTTKEQNQTAIKTFEETKKSNVPSDIIGILRIPKIDLEVAIKEGTSNKVIKYAVGHFEETKYPWENGNCAIAGHRMHVYGQFFNRIDEITPGDEMSIETRQGTFKYKVTEKKIVPPSEVSVLDNTEDKRLTIVTCTPNGEKRIITTAEAVK